MHCLEDWFCEGAVRGDISCPILSLEPRILVTIWNSDLIEQEPALDDTDLYWLPPSIGTGEDKYHYFSRYSVEPQLNKEIYELDLPFMECQTQ